MKGLLASPPQRSRDNWASRWSKTPSTRHVHSSDSSEDELCLGRQKEKKKVIDVYSISDSDDTVEEIDLKIPRTLEPCSDTKSSGNLNCPVRGCLCVLRSVPKLVSHALLSHTKSKFSDEMRDLGWARVSGKDHLLPTLFNIPKVPLKISQNFRPNARKSNQLFTAESAVDIRLTVDPKIGAALVLFCELRNEQRNISQHVSVFGDLNQFFALLAFHAEEITHVSRRRLIRYLALLRDAVFQTTEREDRFTWKQIVSVLHNDETERSISNIVDNLSPIQVAMMARPATKPTVKSIVTALRKFVVSTAQEKFIH